MKSTDIAIVGGGLSGLYAAYLLEKRGIKNYQVFEARDTLGGRIKSATVEPHKAAGVENTEQELNRFDLGPTWYWPDFQPQLHQLILELGLSTFEQFETGDMVVERSPHAQVSRISGYVNAPVSTRLIGGMSSLIDALVARINPAQIIQDHCVRQLTIDDQPIHLRCEDSSGQLTDWRADQVLLALPPRLLEESIRFIPTLPDSLIKQWRATPTWMAPHAKYIAVYETPFWREAGLSGAARSAHGPLVEIHDASMPNGNAALFGFFGVPAQIRQGVSDEVLRTHCRAQFKRLFGSQAATPLIDFIKDWAQDFYTATTADMNAVTHHAQAPDATPPSGPWRNRVMGIASEWSAQFPGYLAGAIEAASIGVDKIVEAQHGRTSMFNHRAIATRSE